MPVVMSYVLQFFGLVFNGFYQVCVTDELLFYEFDIFWSVNTLYLLISDYDRSVTSYQCCYFRSVKNVVRQQKTLQL